MNWILLLPVAGLLFLGLAACDWALYRLEQNEAYQSRWKGFGVGGLVMLLLWGGTVVWSSRPTWASEPALHGPTGGGAPTPAFAWQASLRLASAILERSEPPTLAQARADRTTLHQARRLLAGLPYGSEAEGALIQKADTVLGAAYQTLGQQWFLVRQGQWNGQSRTTSIELLRGEWAKYQTLETCVTGGKSDCLPKTARSERNTLLQSWQRELRLYLLDCIRFDEEDPDLAWLPAAELRASRDRLSLGRAYLTAHPLPAWGLPVTAAADQLFQAADQALRQEEIATAQGSWTKGSMVRVYQPVQQAWDLLFQEALCALESQGSCMKKQQ